MVCSVFLRLQGRKYARMGREVELKEFPKGQGMQRSSGLQYSMDTDRVQPSRGGQAARCQRAAQDVHACLL